KNYPKESRKDVNELSVENKNLEGSLDLSDFKNLEKLDCSHNQLTNLNLSQNSQLEEIYVDKFPKNETSEYLGCEGKKRNEIEKLNISEKGLEGNLDLNDFVNLKELNCSKNNLTSLNINSRIQQGIYNRFYGSLEYFRNFTKLENLNIKNTDVGYGLEYLPRNVAYVDCLSEERLESRANDIYEELQPFVDYNKGEE
ncbi:12642_t:CDS:2, partial [Funneliformis geosporum]